MLITSTGIDERADVSFSMLANREARREAGGVLPGVVAGATDVAVRATHDGYLTRVTSWNHIYVVHKNVGLITALFAARNLVTTANPGRPGDAKPTGLTQSAGLPQRGKTTNG